MILVELIGATNAAGTTQTFYLSTAPFVTQPTDTPANQAFTPALIDPGALGVSAYGDGRTSGASQLQRGDLVIANTDGGFDAWLDYSFEGRAVTIRSGSSGAYPGSYPAIMTATVDSIVVTARDVTVQLRDRQLVLSNPLLVTRYAGTNSLPNGLEGTASDLKGKPKPRIFGQVFNISPALVNTSKLTYQVNDGAVASIDAVYDRGLAKTFSADYATSALLQAASLTSGSALYSTCIAEGYFRLHDAASGQITADVTQGAASANRTVAKVIEAIALAAGISSGEISASDITALDAINSAVVGVFVDDDSSAGEIMDDVAASIGAYYGYDPAGSLRMGVLTAPTGSPVLTIQPYSVLSGLNRRQPTDNGVPVWTVTAQHSRIWNTQGSDLAGSVTAARRAYLSQRTRSAAPAVDAAVKLKFLTAGEMTIDTLLVSEAAAETEAARQLALHKVRRDIFEVPIPVDLYAATPVKFMDVVSLTYPRFGLSAGKLFRVIGRSVELKRNRAVLTLWG